MVEKKATKTAAKKTATKKATTAKTATAAKKTTATAAAKTEVIYLNAENAGFRAGDVTDFWENHKVSSNARNAAVKGVLAGKETSGRR